MRPLTHRLSKLAKSVPLRRVLVVPFVLQISLAVGLIGWLSIRNGQQAVNEVAVQLRSEITARIQQYLQTYVETPHKINQLNADAIRLGEVNPQDFAALEEHLWYQLETFDTVTAVYVASEYREHVAVERAEDGRFQVKVSGDSTGHAVKIYAADRPGHRTKLLRSKSNYDPRTRPWYQSAVKSGTANWGGIYKLFATPQYVLNASLPIYDDRRKLLGVAAVDFSLTGISQFLRSLKIGRSGETFILERRTGLLVGSSATQQPFVIQNPTAPINQQTPIRVKATESSDSLTRRTAKYLQQRFGDLPQIDQTQQLDFDLDGDRQFLQVVPLKTVQGLDWLIVVVVPERDFMDQINANTRTTIVLCLIAFALATALGILTARLISQPILRLGSAAKAIAAGDLDQTVSVTSTTELNGLAQSFNQMAQQLRESFSALARTNEELEDRVEQRTTELGEKNSLLQQEISDRQKAEAALKMSEAELRLMFAAMTDIVVVFDAKGRYLKYMQTQSFTYTSDVDLIGKTVHEVLSESVANTITDAIQQALHLRKQPNASDSTRKNIFVEYHLSIGHQETWFLASVAPLSDDAVLWVARDISKLKKTEAALKQAKESADAANLAKSQFLSNMSHELRTPLNIILGFTQLLLRHRSLNPQQQDYLDTINRSGEDLLTLINDVLEMSKIEAGRVTLNETNFDFYELLDRLRQMFDLKARSRGLELVLDRSDEVPQYICMDESKLRQILVNLLGNAIKFTQIGSVTLRVTTDQTAPDRSIILRFSVEDTGCGIAEADLSPQNGSDTAPLFEPFVQTDAGQKAQEGTGLGLPISQRFVRLMGGDLTVKSTLGEGSIFTFAIPTHPAILEVLPTFTPSRQVVSLAAGQPHYRILIVEDKLENRRLLVELLAPIGFELQEAVNGQAAIELWQSWAPDLIWMDLRMPVMNGFEATQHIKAANNSAPVIIALTGSAFEEDRLTALSVGFDDFVRKPFRTSVIFEKMAEHLGVRYVYADESDDRQNALSPDPSLTPSDLSEMPIEWIDQLHQAALRINAKQILLLIEQIPEPYDHLVKALTDLVDRFCFEEIIALTQR
ncbi:HAMP domain-containing protein [Phormidesmis priestleyi ULC007]|uniref:Circadian input-output histidine kinase CikA n=1 Tax=Phormidesmis priestleyi ULC007 TaxID=1920490 RepID=A0A2T1DI11_9CYAN|nr:hybrid sensor histidine kinase/response regulator [Phormidesmis priestleyi]PSB20117.1 HAMP domain-containing protein [Phormidesmis priestleyi ULC007]PZO48981.1 MAG: HAMP domain-containing protein [Phormidesmis priestleyi]